MSLLPSRLWQIPRENQSLSVSSSPCFSPCRLTRFTCASCLPCGLRNVPLNQAFDGCRSLLRCYRAILFGLLPLLSYQLAVNSWSICWARLAIKGFEIQREVWLYERLLFAIHPS